MADEQGGMPFRSERIPAIAQEPKLEVKTINPALLDELDLQELIQGALDDVEGGKPQAQEHTQAVNEVIFQAQLDRALPRDPLTATNRQRRVKRIPTPPTTEARIASLRHRIATETPADTTQQGWHKRQTPEALPQTTPSLTMDLDAADRNRPRHVVEQKENAAPTEIQTDLHHPALPPQERQRGIFNAISVGIRDAWKKFARERKVVDEQTEDDLKNETPVLYETTDTPLRKTSSTVATNTILHAYTKFSPSQQKELIDMLNARMEYLPDNELAHADKSAMRRLGNLVNKEQAIHILEDIHQFQQLPKDQQSFIIGIADRMRQNDYRGATNMRDHMNATIRGKDGRGYKLDQQTGQIEVIHYNRLDELAARMLPTPEEHAQNYVHKERQQRAKRMNQEIPHTIVREGTIVDTKNYAALTNALHAYARANPEAKGAMKMALAQKARKEPNQLYISKQYNAVYQQVNRVHSKEQAAFVLINLDLFDTLTDSEQQTITQITKLRRAGHINEANTLMHNATSTGSYSKPSGQGEKKNTAHPIMRRILRGLQPTLEDQKEKIAMAHRERVAERIRVQEDRASAKAQRQDILQTKGNEIHTQEAQAHQKYTGAEFTKTLHSFLHMSRQEQDAMLSFLHKKASGFHEKNQDTTMSSIQFERAANVTNKIPPRQAEKILHHLESLQAMNTSEGNNIINRIIKARREGRDTYANNILKKALAKEDNLILKRMLLDLQIPEKTQKPTTLFGKVKKFFFGK